MNSSFGKSSMAYRLSFVLFLVCFRANQRRFDKVFVNPAIKHMDALKNSVEQSLKIVQFLVDFIFM